MKPTNMVKNKKLIIFAGILFIGFWVLVIANTLSGSESAPVSHQPGTVAVQPSSPVATPYVPVASQKASANILRHNGVSASMTPTKSTSSYATSGSAPALHAYLTSNATMHSVSGGGNSGSNAAVSSGNNGSKGVNYATTAYTGAIYLNPEFDAITEVGASSAKMIARTVTPEPNQAPTGPRKLPGHEEEWWLTPVGDVVWALMALLALAYAYYVYKKRARA